MMSFGKIPTALSTEVEMHLLPYHLDDVILTTLSIGGGVMVAMEMLMKKWIRHWKGKDRK